MTHEDLARDKAGVQLHGTVKVSKLTSQSQTRLECQECDWTYSMWANLGYARQAAERHKCET